MRPFRSLSARLTVQFALLFAAAMLAVSAALSSFIAGASDWGPYQRPGELETMQTRACTRMTGCHFVDGAGHWVQQEQPERVSALLVEFLQRNAPRDSSQL